MLSLKMPCAVAVETTVEAESWCEQGGGEIYSCALVLVVTHEVGLAQVNSAKIYSK